MPRNVTRLNFDIACEALWAELQYQDNLPRRTEDEAKDVPGFLTLGRVYAHKAAVDWSDHAGDELALHGLRKLAAIYLRGMVYCGVRKRERLGSLSNKELTARIEAEEGR